MPEHHVPGPNEPDPKNLRGRPFQGGTDGLPDGGPTLDQTYGQMRYEDGDGPFASLRLPGGAGSGLSGLPQASAGVAPAQFDNPDSPPAEGRKPNDEVTDFGPGEKLH